MHLDITAVPAVDRAAAGVILASEWRTADPGQQQRAADAALHAWRHSPWPEGLIAHNCLLGEDGVTVLHYIQWSGEDAARAFAAAGKPQWARIVDESVPGIDHREATAYRLYRSTTLPGQAPSAGCLVTVTVDFDGPDESRQRAWVDNAFAAAGTADPSPEAGMLAAHFHLSLDGTRVLNLAQWTTSQAHRDSIDSAAVPARRFRAAVRDFPGVARSTARRYTPGWRATPPGKRFHPARLARNV